MSKQTLNRTRKAYQNTSKADNISKESLRQAHLLQRNIYKNLLRAKRRTYNEHRKAKLRDLKSSTPKDFLKLHGNGKKSNGACFDKNSLFNYFSNLLDSNASTIQGEACAENTDNQVENETNNLVNDILNSEITLDEVTSMVSNLKKDKASGIDLISAELLKSLNDSFLAVFQTF